MTEEIFNVQQTIDKTVEVFYLDRDGVPELVPLGLPPLDKELGGLGPRSCGILAAATGVGKSSAMLAAMLQSTVKVGAISLEDGPDVVGTRLLSALTGIDSLRIRRKALSKGELSLIAKARKTIKLNHMHFAYPIAGSLEQVCEAVNEMTALGCKMIWVDYLQEIRGHGKNDRRNEVSEAMTRIHRETAKGNAALMMISQFRRPGQDAKGNTRPVGIHHLKESGDLENKARIIVIAQKQPSPDAEDRVRFKLAKSTYGGEYVKWDMVRDESGTLRDASFYSPTEDF